MTKPITPAKLNDMTDDDLRSLVNDRNQSDTTHARIEIILQEREEAADRKRLAELMEEFADHVDTDAALLGNFHFGAGVNARTVTSDDLYRIAELLDPGTV